MKDVRRDSILVFDYSVGLKSGRGGRLHPSVRIHPARYRELKRHFLEIATRRGAEALAAELRNLHFERYAPVGRQLAALLRHVNRARGTAGLEPIDGVCLQRAHRSVRVFVDAAASEAKAA